LDSVDIFADLADALSLRSDSDILHRNGDRSRAYLSSYHLSRVALSLDVFTTMNSWVMVDGVLCGGLKLSAI
jgi:hypothetical protein